MRPGDGLSEMEARALWERAARLDSETRDSQRRLLHDGGVSGDGEASGDSVPYDLARRAAAESGIDGASVDRARVQLTAERYLDSDPRAERWARMLAFDERTISERTLLDAEATAVRGAVAATLDSEAYRMDLIEYVPVGEDDSVAVYEVPATLTSMLQVGGFHYQVRTTSDIERVAVIVSPSPDGGTTVELHATLGKSLRANAIALRVIQIVGAVGGGIVTALVLLIVGDAFGLRGTSAYQIASSAIGVVLAAGSGVGAGGLYRRAYRSAHAKVHASFRKVLMAVRSRLTGRRG